MIYSLYIAVDTANGKNNLRQYNGTVCPVSDNTGHTVREAGFSAITAKHIDNARFELVD